MDPNMSSPLWAKMLDSVEIAKSMKEEEKLHRHNGVLYPVVVCPQENLKALETLQARPDDVMLVAYPKCGFNWMEAVLNKIIEAACGIKAGKIPPLIEFLGAEGLQFLNQAPSPRMLGTHMHPDNLPPSFGEKKTKMLFVFRNPKDTAVSYYHFTNKNPVLPTAESWDQFYSDFMNGEVSFGSYFDYVLAWEKRVDDPNVMIVTFEELKEDLREGVRQISEFFGFSLTEAQTQSIAEQSTFGAMKESSKDSHGQMGNVIFRKGEVGDWKNHFSLAQSKQMDAAFEEHLGGTKLGAKLKYDVHCKW